MQTNPMEMLKAFNQFRQSFSGDPEQQVKKLVCSGKLSQQQLNQAQEAARLFQQAFGIK